MARGTRFDGRARLTLLALLTLAIALPVAFAARRASAGWLPATASGRSASALGITGNRIGGLYPGASRTLTLTLRNRDSKHAIDVRRVRVRDVGTTVRGCKASRRNLRLRQSRLKLVTIAPGGSYRVHALLTMPNSVANACQGAAFELRYSAQVSRRGHS